MIISSNPKEVFEAMDASSFTFTLISFFGSDELSSSWDFFTEKKPGLEEELIKLGFNRCCYHNNLLDIWTYIENHKLVYVKIVSKPPVLRKLT